MTDMECLYLYRLLNEHLASLTRKIEKNRRYWSSYRPDDDLLYYRKVIVYEDEYEKMESIRNQLQERVAQIELQKSFVIDENLD